MKKILSTAVILVIVFSTLSMSAPRAEASGTVKIMPDGSIDPPTAPIERVGDVYTVTDDIHDKIVIHRSNMIFDGSGHTVEGGFWLTGYYAYLSNVTIRKTRIEGIVDLLSTSNSIISGNLINSGGISLRYDSNDNVVAGNILANGFFGVENALSTDNTITANIITGNGVGIRTSGPEYGHSGTSPGNMRISYNIIANNGYGVHLERTHDSNVTGNIIVHNYRDGVFLGDTIGVRVVRNIVADNGLGISMWRGDYRWARDNVIFHNSFMDNMVQVEFVDSWQDYPYPWLPSLFNSWDNGYPLGGNYWSDYPTKYPSIGDEYQGENQDIPGSDGIWDHPYIIYTENQDNYPLVHPLGSLEGTLFNVQHLQEYLTALYENEEVNQYQYNHLKRYLAQTENYIHSAVSYLDMVRHGFDDMVEGLYALKSAVSRLEQLINDLRNWVSWGYMPNDLANQIAQQLEAINMAMTSRAWYEALSEKMLAVAAIEDAEARGRSAPWLWNEISYIDQNLAEADHWLAEGWMSKAVSYYKNAFWRSQRTTINAWHWSWDFEPKDWIDQLEESL